MDEEKASMLSGGNRHASSVTNSYSHLFETKGMKSSTLKTFQFAGRIQGFKSKWTHQMEEKKRKRKRKACIRSNTETRRF